MLKLSIELTSEITYQYVILIPHYGYFGFNVKEKLISISKPTPKVEIQDDESELPSNSVETQETVIIEEFPELTDIVEPKNVRYASTYQSGWKASDILREIRLDSFEMGN